jgi:hypothetical protein
MKASPPESIPMFLLRRERMLQRELFQALLRYVDERWTSICLQIIEFSPATRSVLL